MKLLLGYKFNTAVAEEPESSLVSCLHISVRLYGRNPFKLQVMKGQKLWKLFLGSLHMLINKPIQLVLLCFVAG